MFSYYNKTRGQGVRAARRVRPRWLRRRRQVAAVPLEHAVTIRYAFADDAYALARLAALDSSPEPAQPMLVAEVDGSLRAALSIADGLVIADPFHPTMALVELLIARAEQLSAPAPSTPRPFGPPVWRGVTLSSRRQSL